MITTYATLVHKYDSPSGYVSLVLFQVNEVFAFTEGQFVMIHAEINGKLVKRPYSIATTNKQLQEEKIIGFVVKKTSEFGMSNWLTQCIEHGCKIEIKGPVGHYIDDQKNTKYLLVSVGSGLSPNLGLFKHLVYESSQPIQLVNIFGERYHKHIVPEIASIFLNHGKTDVHNMFYLSQEEELPTGYSKGHVQLGIARAIEKLGTHTTCFLCGKPEMVDDVRKQLIELGVPTEYINFEKY